MKLGHDKTEQNIVMWTIKLSIKLCRNAIIYDIIISHKKRNFNLHFVIHFAERKKSQILSSPSSHEFQSYNILCFCSHLFLHSYDNDDISHSTPSKYRLRLMFLFFSLSCCCSWMDVAVGEWKWKVESQIHCHSSKIHDTHARLILVHCFFASFCSPLLLRSQTIVKCYDMMRQNKMRIHSFFFFWLDSHFVSPSLI